MTRTHAPTTTTLDADTLGDMLALVSGLLADEDDHNAGHAPTAMDLHIVIRDDVARPAAIDFMRETRNADGEPSAAADEALERLLARLRVSRAEGGPGLLPPLVKG